MARPGRLARRNTQLLTKLPRQPNGEPTVTYVKKSEPHWCVPVTQLAHGEHIEANATTSRPVVLRSILTVDKQQACDFESDEWRVAIGGTLSEPGKIILDPGEHTVLFFCNSFYGHNKDLAFPWKNLAGWGEWQVAVIDEFLYRDTDMRWLAFENKAAKAVEEKWNAAMEGFSNAWKKPEDVFPSIGKRVDQIFMKDAAAEFAARELSAEGDREFCYDFGEQTCGYVEFSIQADAGVIVDLNMVEYITPDGTIQHTLPFNRNGMRYITKKGVNRFRSLKRRAGQFLFVTIRNAESPIDIRSVRIIESTASVKPVQAFESSDSALNKIWSMSERALKLCMEDTFTDCPLYEQTLWIGDARNEALYAFAAYGNYDVSARSLELGAQSLDRFPMVGCQVPSSWECLLPAWSFLWGLHVWEHYFHSGDKRFLKKLWPAVLKNLEGAEQFVDEHGLFSGPLWNLLEWAPIDHDNETVLHNSMLWVGALQAAERCAEALGDSKVRKKLETRRAKLISAINAQWNDEKGSYPDAIVDATNLPSDKVCQHTSMLAIMCNVASSKVRKQALNNLLNPPDGMTTIGAPFAMQFMFEALEAMCEYDAILDTVREKFQPMVDVGASTVWELFAGSDFDSKGFPTRSHCHAWSSSPIWFLNRIVLGIRQTDVGGKAFEISPWVTGLQHASGAMATPKGSVHVGWTLSDKTLRVNVRAPQAIEMDFKLNTSHDGLDVKWERNVL